MGGASTEQSTLARNTFVGRERELDELRAALEEVAEGYGRMFLMSGEPGIGKTRLAEEIAHEATSRGMRALWGRCWEGEGAPAFWPWIQVIRGCIGLDSSPERRGLSESEQLHSVVETVAQLVPELRGSSGHPRKPALASEMDAAQARFRLFDSVATLLKNLTRLAPLAIIIDDLHDADEASLAMLRFVARELKGAPVLIVATYRDAEVRRSAELTSHIGRLGRDARPVPLAGFNHTEVVEFVVRNSASTAHEDLISKIHAATGGNPLYVDGVVRLLASHGDASPDAPLGEHFKIPDTVREAIRRRLATLSDEAHQLLNVAAVIGDEFDAEICVRVAGISRSAPGSPLDEVLRGGIATSLGNGRYRFAHTLIRGAIYDAFGNNSRIRLHREVGEAIESLYANDLDPHVAALARHFQSAGDNEKTINYSFQAALVDQKLQAASSAAGHLRLALALTEGRSDLLRAHILLNFGTANAFHLDRGEGVASLKVALKLFRELKEEKWAAQTNSLLGMALLAAPPLPYSKVNEALEYLRQASEWTGDWADPSSHGWLHCGIAICHHSANRLEEAIEAARRAREIWERASDLNWVIAAGLQALCLTARGLHGEADNLIQLVCALAQETEQGRGTDTSYPPALRAVGLCRLIAHDPLEAVRLYSLGLRQKGLSPHLRTDLLNHLCRAEVNAGNLEGAMAAAAGFKVDPILKFVLAFRHGDWETAIQDYLPVLAWYRQSGAPGEEASILDRLAEIQRTAGNFQEAHEYAHQALARLDRIHLMREIDFRPRAALIAMELGRIDEAKQHLEVCRAILAQGENWRGMAAVVEHADGVLAAAQGRESTPYFEKAVAIAKRYSSAWDEADALRDWGIALNRAGDHVQADEKFDGAIAIYRRSRTGQRWIDRIEAARGESASAKDALEPRAFAVNVFKREGEFWTISYAGATFRLRDAKGLHYIAYLLARPGQRMHVHDLIEAVEGSAANGRTTIHAESEDLEIVREIDGPVPTIDARARSEYRATLRELQAELDEAQRTNDLGRAERLRIEIEMVGEELTGSSRIGGHARTASRSAERARGLVGKNIRSVVEKIRHEHPALGRHFAAAISTGYFCSYQPDPDHPVSWQL